jgi:hypothetical protein
MQDWLDWIQPSSTFDVIGPMPEGYEMKVRLKSKFLSILFAQLQRPSPMLADVSAGPHDQRIVHPGLHEMI